MKKITQRKLRQIIKEELSAAARQKVYLVTLGYGSMAIGIFSSMEVAEEAVLKDIEYEHREMGDTAVKREDYNIDEYYLDKGRS